ncbi:MAG TPA: hypothetical protein VHQ65_03415 [Thermoanaerobaculia bacterium]|nr:hypothetical protein [Thermoanaerobaculia bacterium]
MTTASTARALRCLRLGLIALAPALLPAATTLGAAPPPCPPGLPFVLNVALPAGEAGDREELARRGRELEALLVGGQVALQPCVRERGLQANIAIGSDYQVLHWLEQGAVDLAVVSELALHLLRRSGLELLEAGQAPAALLPGRRAVLRSRSADGSERPDAASDFRAFLEETWQTSGQTVERNAPREPPLGARLELGSHLDTTRFLVPVAAAQRWLQAAHGEAPPQRQERFWTRFFDRTCLIFPGDREARDGGAPCHAPGRAGGGRPVLQVVEEVVPPPRC